MNFRPLGQTGFQVSELALGTMIFGWRADARESEAILDHSIDQGINLIDTSNSYGKGASETIIGNWVRNSGKRDRAWIATKFHYWKEGDPPGLAAKPREHIIHQCEESLRRLKIDTIDLYQIHRHDPAYQIEETIEVLADLRRVGKIRWIGTSSSTVDQLERTIQVANSAGMGPLASEQPPYNLLDRSIETELLPATQKTKTGVITWSPLAEGLLTGKYKAKTPIPRDSRYAAFTQPEKYHVRLTAELFEKLDQAERVARRLSISLSELALARCLNHPGISSVLVGPSKLQQMNSAMNPLNIRLDSSLLAEIDSIFPISHPLVRYY